MSIQDIETFWYGMGAKDLTLSRELIDAYTPAPRHCWWNARRALVDGIEDGILHPDTRYAEGHAVMNCAPITFEHGWLVLPDGVTVADPTLDEPGYCYFAAQTFTAEECWHYGNNPVIVGDEMIGLMSYALHGRHWGKLHSSPEWTRANLQAYFAAGYPQEWLQQIGAFRHVDPETWAAVEQHFRRHHRP